MIFSYNLTRSIFQLLCDTNFIMYVLKQLIIVSPAIAPLFCVTDLLEAPDNEDIEPIRKAKTFYASCMNTRNFIQHYSLT